MNLNQLPETILETKKLVFDALGLEFKNAVQEKESQDYKAFRFELNNLKILFREAKTTPTKIGQFVTLWKRISNNPIEPFQFSDDFDFVIIKSKTNLNNGLFVLSKKILIEKGIISTDKKLGKLGFRVYPSWDKTENNQAKKTQNWQTNYFIEIHSDQSINLELSKKLFSKD
jgi:hypothetical protein